MTEVYLKPQKIEISSVLLSRPRPLAALKYYIWCLLTYLPFSRKNNGKEWRWKWLYMHPWRIYLPHYFCEEFDIKITKENGDTVHMKRLKLL